MSNQHIIQVRDLAEMLSREDQTAPVDVCTNNAEGGGDHMNINRLERTHPGSRTVSITVHSDSRITQLEDELLKLEEKEGRGRLLIEKLDALLDEGADSIGFSDILSKLGDQVKEHLKQ